MSDRAFPIIHVPDLPATCAFYEELGFAQAYRFPLDGDAAFVTMQRGSSSIGIGAGGSGDRGDRGDGRDDGGDGGDRFGYWVYVEDVDEALARLRARGAPVVAEPEDQPWGERLAQTRDPGGNLVYLGAAL